MSRKAGRKAGRTSPGKRSPAPDRLLLRIVGGRLRGRQIVYDGEQRTRPMKDRVREAVFNLVGPAVKGKLVLDLFAGTGAMGLEAVSRGAASVIAVERSFPAARMVSDNATTLGIESHVTTVRADVFRWWQEQSTNRDSPWLVFCCPPYALYTEQRGEMVKLIEGLVQRAPPGSLIVLEFDQQFPADQLPDSERWDVRRYSPANIAVFECQAEN